MAQSKIMYDRRKGINADHGIVYERDTTTSVILQCEKLHQEWKQDNTKGVKSFVVLNNVDNIGAFDDVVVRVEYPDGGINKTKLLFVQCKHFQNPESDKLLDSKLTRKYFDSFVSVIRILNDDTISWVAFNEKEVNSYFQLYRKNKKMREEAVSETGQAFTDAKFENYLRRKIKVDLARNRENLKAIFDCQYSDCEFFLYSNMTSVPGGPPENHMQSDISCRILNSGQGGTFATSLEERHLSALRYEDYNHFRETDFERLKTEFSRLCRISTNQVINTEVVSSLIEDQSDCKIITKLLSKEQELIFGNSMAITEKSELLDILRNYSKLLSNSRSEQNQYLRFLDSRKVFTNESISRLKEETNAEGTTEIYTSCLQLERLKLMQFFVNEMENEKFVVFIKDEIDLASWEKSRKAELYKNLKQVLVCSEFGNIFSDFTKDRNEVFINIHTNNEIQNSCIDEFSEETTNSVLNYEITFQGNNVTVNDVCGERWRDLLDENTICKIIKNERIIIDSYTLPTLDECYVPRKLQIKALDTQFVEKLTQHLSNSNEENKYLIFSEKNHNLPSKETSKIWFTNISEARNYLKHIQDQVKNDAIHFCSYYNGQLELFYSLGSKNFNISFKELKEDEVYLSKIKNISILTGPAGMGKTATLICLALMFKKKNPSYWVFVIELNKHLDELKNYKCGIEISDGIDFVASSILKLKKQSLEHKLFVDACQENRNVALFFDAFDEISPEGEKRFTSLLETLEKSKISHIFVSSRLNYVRTLETTFMHNSIEFLPFDSNDKKKFLLKYLENLTKIKGTDLGEDEIKNITNVILKSIEVEKGILDELVSIPLQTKMLADIYFEKLSEMPIEEREKLTFKTDLYTLYTDFVEKLVERYLFKMNMPKRQKRHKNIAIADKMIGAEKIACELVCPDFTMNFPIENRDDVIVKLKDQVGLITNIDPLVFLHRTIAEFLVAKHFVDCINKENENTAAYTYFFCKNILLEKKYLDVRRFINAALCNSNSKTNNSRYINPHVIIKVSWYHNYKTSVHIAAKEGNTAIVELLYQKELGVQHETDKNCRTALHHACRSRSLETVKALFSNYGCSMEVEDYQKRNPLHFAVESGSTDIMQLFLSPKLTLLYMKDRYGLTPFNLACKRNQTKAAKCLLSYDEDLVNIADEEGYFPIHYAAENENIEIIDQILKYNPNLLNKKTECGQTPLHCACIHNQTQAAKKLFEYSSCLLDVKDNIKDTPLHWASRNDNVEIMEHILDRKPKLLNKRNTNGETPLLCALYVNQRAAAKFLLTFSECDVSTSENPLLCASKIGDVEIIKNIYERDKTLLNKVGNDNDTPLIYALRYEKTEAAQYLLNLPNCKLVVGRHDKSPLHHASAIGNTDIMRQLLNKDYNLLNKLDNNGKSALIVACKSNKTEAALYLLNLPGCSLIGDEYGKSPLHYASARGNTEIMQKLLKMNYSLSYKLDNNGRSALHSACENNKIEAAKFLVMNTELISVAKTRSTILHNAINKDYIEIIKLLLQYDNTLINERASCGLSPLEVAIKCNETEAAKIFLGLIDLPLVRESTWKDNSLHIASKVGNVDIMKLILKKNPSLLDKEDSDSNTPLHLACEWDETEAAAKYLLTCTPCSVNLPNSKKDYPIHSASRNGNYDIFKLVLKRNDTLLNMQNKKKETPLHLVFECSGYNSERNDTAKFILDYYIEPLINLADVKGQTPFHSAAKAGYCEIMILMLERDKTLLNKQDRKGRTPLHLACENKNYDAVSLLLGHSACNICLNDKKGNTPLHYAAFGCSDDKNTDPIMSLLVKRNRSLLTMTNTKGKTALHLAIENQHMEAILILLSHIECTAQVQDENGDTLIHFCVLQSNRFDEETDVDELIFVLLRHDRSQVNKRNHYGDTPLHIAVNMSFKHAVESLVSRGADINMKDVNDHTPLDLAHQIVQVRKKSSASDSSIDSSKDDEEILEYLQEENKRRGNERRGNE